MQVAALSEVCEVVMGQSPPSSSYNARGDGLPFFQGKLDFSDTYPKVRVFCNQPSRIALPGDVLISVRAPVGPTNLVDRKCCIGRGLSALRPNGRLSTLYLWYFLRHFEPRLASRGVGSTFDAINRDDLEELQIPVPDLTQQKRIAAILEQADRLLRLRRYGLEMAEDLLPTVFDRLFGDPVVNPKRWKLISVGEAGKVQLGRQRAPQYQTGRHRRRYMRVANVYEDRIDLSDVLSMDFDDNDFREYKLEYGDILLNEGQSTELVGRPAMWRNELPDCCFQNTLVRFQCNLRLCLPQFALWLFIKYLHRGAFAKMSAKTSNVAHLGAYRLAQMPFPVPPLSLQGEFAAIVEQCGHMRAIHRESLHQAEHLFGTLLHRAFAGGL
jgi:type I restriction enzyme S subunit